MPHHPRRVLLSALGRSRRHERVCISSAKIHICSRLARIPSRYKMERTYLRKVKSHGNTQISRAILCEYSRWRILNWTRGSLSQGINHRNAAAVPPHRLICIEANEFTNWSSLQITATFPSIAIAFITRYSSCL